jgi:hypothetical protein
MGMRRRLMKGVGYAVAPKFTFAAMHPRKAAFGKAASWAMHRVARRSTRRSHSPAMIGLGAAALALPVGLWLGRRFRSNQ